MVLSPMRAGLEYKTKTKEIKSMAFENGNGNNTYMPVTPMGGYYGNNGNGWALFIFMERSL